MSNGDKEGAIFLGRSFVGGTARDEYLSLALANRHGLATGATGTGKTVTLQVLAEGFSRAGVPVFAADIKGDLSGIAARGTSLPFLLKRAEEVGLTYQPDLFPVTFWDLFGQQGHPIRTTVSEMGPLLLARLMGLNETQEGVLNIVFRVADEQGLLLLDLKDLRAMLAFVAEHAATLTRTYGNVSSVTVGAIQRQILVLENQGADSFFGEPALRIEDLMQVDRSGYGMVSILAADRLMGSPRLYACFLLWLLAELFEQLPEVGDLPKPKLVFFFDEAHLLFDEAPKVLLDKVEQVVRLIRSKGVGVYFVTQNPLDVPEKVLAQLGNRVQHALRAFTPRDQKAVKAAAETFRPNPRLDTAAVITELGKGEALVSTLEGNGTPTMVQRTLIRPPSGRVGPLSVEERAAIISASPFARIYDASVDRRSAFEMLEERANGRVPADADADTGAGADREAERPAGPWGRSSDPAGAPRPRTAGVPTIGVPKVGNRRPTAPADGDGDRLPPASPAPRRAPKSAGPASDEAAPRSTRAPSTRTSTRMSTTELVVRQVARSVASQVGTQLGRAILRGILGGIKR